MTVARLNNINENTVGMENAKRKKEDAKDVDNPKTRSRIDENTN